MYIILFLLPLFIGWGLYEILKPKKTNFENLKTDNGVEPNCYIQTNYYGGFRDVSAKDIPFVNIYTFDDKVRFIFNLYGKLINYKDIPKENILSIEYMNEVELRESISIGKVAVFGLIGVAMKNQKEINREYILLRCMCEGKKIDVALNNTYGSSNKECFEIMNNYILNIDKELR